MTELDLFSSNFLRRKPEVSSSALRNGLKQNFDFSSVITIGGLWAIWQAYLVKILFVICWDQSATIWVNNQCCNAVILYFRVEQELYHQLYWEIFGIMSEILGEIIKVDSIGSILKMYKCLIYFLRHICL